MAESVETIEREFAHSRERAVIRRAEERQRDARARRRMKQLAAGCGLLFAIGIGIGIWAVLTWV
jgi:hypothetical protein